MEKQEEAISKVLDEQAYVYLESNVPAMIAAIEMTLGGQTGPEDIFRMVVSQAPYHDPYPFAAKCRAAARHIQRVRAL